MSNIKVFCRFRPISQKETDKLNYIIDQPSIKIGEQGFTYDKIFDSDSSQSDVYDSVGKPMVEQLLQGLNATLLMYGQTSSGKTHTMIGDEKQPGMIKRTITDLFEAIASSPKEVEFRMKLSIFEIYKEKIKDLLDQRQFDLKVRELPTGFFVQALTQQWVSDEREILLLLQKAIGDRCVGQTQLNDQSSRSHLIFSLSLLMNNEQEGTSYQSQLLMADLAGSENATKAGTSGNTLQEGSFINKSLLTLSNVINALSDKSQHVPFRESNLTKVLWNGISRNSITNLIITCSPCVLNESETISTLRFGTRAKMIKTQPKINKQVTVKELELINEKLNKELQEKQFIIDQLKQNNQYQLTIKLEEENLQYKTQNADLNEQLQYVRQEYSILQNDVLDLETSRKQYQQQIAHSLRESQKHQEEINLLQSQIQEHQAQIKMLMVAQESSQQEVLNARTELDQIKLELQSRDHQITEYQKQIGYDKILKEQVQSDFDNKNEESQAQIEKQQGQVLQLQEVHSKDQNEIRETKKQLDESNAVKTHQEQTIKSQTEVQQQLKEIIENLQIQLAAEQVQKIEQINAQEKDQVITNLNKEIAQLKEEHTNQKLQQIEFISSKDAKIAQSNQLLQELKSTVEAQTKEANLFREQLLQKQQTIEQQDQQLQQVIKEKKEIQSKQSSQILQSDNVKSEINSQNFIIRELNEQIQELKSQLQVEQAKSSQFQASLTKYQQASMAQQKINNTQSNVQIQSNYSQDSSQNSQQKQSQQASPMNFQHLSNYGSSASPQLALTQQAPQQQTNIPSEVSDFASNFEIEQLRKQLNDANKKLSQYATMIKQFQHDIVEYQRKLQFEQTEFRKTQSVFDAQVLVLSQQNSAYQEQIEYLSEQAKLLAQTKDKLEKDLANRIQKVVYLEETKDTLKEHLNRLRSSLGGQEQFLLDENQRLTAQLETVNKQYMQQVNEHILSQSHSKVTQQRMTSKTQRIQQLEMENQDLKFELQTKAIQLESLLSLQPEQPTVRTSISKVVNKTNNQITQLI